MHDLDEEMRKRKIQALVVTGDTTLGNPDLTYVVGGFLARGGIYFKKQDEPPLLVTSNLDIATARKWGRVRRIETYTEWGVEKLASKYGRAEAMPRLLAKVLRKQRVGGRVVLFGRDDLASGIWLASRLRKFGFKVVGESPPTILESAREVKSREEIQTIRRVGEKTAKVVETVVANLRKMKRKRGHLQIGKSRATIGAVKKMISLELAKQGLTAPEGTIFAIGPSGADPHNMGVPSDPIKEGKLIVFDIFPQDESGYWFDLTRTFVVGRADKKTRRIFEAVYEAQTTSLDLMHEGVTGDQAMSKTCDVIEKHGYRTIREVYQGKTKNLTSGFNHSLGHGVGLTIGERPYLSFLSKDPLKRGNVVTVEPGVYIPRYGGVRIEDTISVTARGFNNLANVEKELEIT